MFGLMPWRREKAKSALALHETDPFTLMRREFDNLFDSFFGRWPMAMPEGWDRSAGWGLDLVEEEKEIVVRAEAPGFEPADFDLRVSDHVLTVVAEHKVEMDKKEDEKDKKDSAGNGHRRAYTRFERMVTLPANADEDKVAALYKNGVLEVRFPKKVEAEGKRIEVKA